MPKSKKDEEAEKTEEPQGTEETEKQKSESFIDFDEVIGEELQELDVIKQLPVLPPQEALVYRIEKAKAKAFFPDNAKNPEQPLIRVSYAGKITNLKGVKADGETIDKLKDMPFSGKRILAYYVNPSKTSNLGKFLSRYGELRKGIQIFVVNNRDTGFWEIVGI